MSRCAALLVLKIHAKRKAGKRRTLRAIFRQALGADCTIAFDAGGDPRGAAALQAAEILLERIETAYLRHLHAHYPRYGFLTHRGRPTPEHFAAIRLYGPCPEHRVQNLPPDALAAVRGNRRSMKRKKKRRTPPGEGLQRLEQTAEGRVRIVARRYDGQPLDGSRLYGGLGEVGVGSIAGPMAASIVVLAEDHGIPGLPRDSKLMSHEDIRATAALIRERALFYVTCTLDAQTVDQLGARRSRRLLWRRCAAELRAVAPDMKIVVGGVEPIQGIENQEAVEKADATHASVSAAAIISKDYTNQVMEELASLCPAFRFNQHHGYPTSGHLEEIRRNGFLPVHRRRIAGEHMNKQQVGEASL